MGGGEAGATPSPLRVRAQEGAGSPRDLEALAVLPDLALSWFCRRRARWGPSARMSQASGKSCVAPPWMGKQGEERGDPATRAWGDRAFKSQAGDASSPV